MFSSSCRVFVLFFDIVLMNCICDMGINIFGCIMIYVEFGVIRGFIGFVLGCEVLSVICSFELDNKCGCKE